MNCEPTSLAFLVGLCLRRQPVQELSVTSSLRRENTLGSSFHVVSRRSAIEQLHSAFISSRRAPEWTKTQQFLGRSRTLYLLEPISRDVFVNIVNSVADHDGQHSVAESVALDEASESPIWTEIARLSRLMNEAVEVENYEDAALYRDQLKVLEEKIEVCEPERTINESTSASALSEALQMLESGSRLDRSCAVDMLGELGDTRAVEHLVRCLQDPDPEMRAKAEKSLWAIFHKYGMEEVDKRLQEGVMAMQRGQLEGSIRVFTDVVRLAPDFAEGYNKRATAHYLLRNFEESIRDCQLAVELQPKHFGAWSGMGLCNVGLKRFEEAVECFQKAVEINPNMMQVKQYLIAVKVMISSKGGKGSLS
mmetsp:Transcript_40797/g.66161  ORF Transcript_40797/g.66161 Transcript_40797/m.66161 type:complete len:365 (+) Transcript_40797:56-1150(+)|eukprot:CAMPEP_0184646246 /NCGR_PEP_ID=MMETSP0308-20130426/2905_1 /TAXON_ID=38269 /ORGANISM="Gloeochaete witrockiana, Strain SAG 46.84" /LENGTH=364 /DNA_ID=CAMNT_0027076071 /DNA_START=142 /DNA_END=1236 /DNA_ORIENTATION=+